MKQRGVFDQLTLIKLNQPVFQLRYVKVQCVHKSVPPELSSSRGVVRLSVLYRCGRFRARYGHP
jgi:hypothetical protein